MQVHQKVSRHWSRRNVSSSVRLLKRASRLLSSVIDELPSDGPSNEWEITKKAPNSDGKLLLIRGKADRKHLAVIKIYSNQQSTDLYREVTVMKDLKGKMNIEESIGNLYLY